MHILLLIIYSDDIVYRKMKAVIDMNAQTDCGDHIIDHVYLMYNSAKFKNSTHDATYYDFDTHILHIRGNETFMPGILMKTLV